MAQRRKSKYVEPDSDNEELQDEITQFHNNKSKVDRSAYSRQKNEREEEVLNVEGDASDNEGATSDDSLNPFEIDDNDTPERLRKKLRLMAHDPRYRGEEFLPNDWGISRTAYYGTGYVDDDFGGMREEEIENAELEEEDVINRQKRFDQITADVTNILDEQDDEEEKKKNVESVKVEEEWSLKEAKKRNKEYQELCSEYARRAELMVCVVQPLADLAPKLHPGSVIGEQIYIIIEVYANYLMDMLVVLKLKSSSFASKKMKDKSVDLHPAQARLLKLKPMMKRVDDFIDLHFSTFMQLSKALSPSELLPEYKMVVEPLRIKKSLAYPPVTSKDEDNDADAEDADDADGEMIVDENGERRLAPSSIAKNAQSKKQKKKKNRTAKTANRHRYREISKKVRSQIGTIRKEDKKYTGESRGIRKGVIKSTKLLA